MKLAIERGEVTTSSLYALRDLFPSEDLPTWRDQKDGSNQTENDYALQFCRAQDVLDMSCSSFLLLPALHLSPSLEPSADYP